jgi:hypothetical protein
VYQSDRVKQLLVRRLHLLQKGSYHVMQLRTKRKEALPSRSLKGQRKIKCHVCHEYRHTKHRRPKNCAAETMNQVTMVKHHDDSDESAGFIVNHVTSASISCLLNNSWIVDSGTTCHMCNRSELFIEFT